MQLFVVLVKLTNVVVALVKVAAVVNAPDGEELSACVCVCFNDSGSALNLINMYLIAK